MANNAGWGHIKLASEIYSVKAILPFLCDLAYDTVHHHDKFRPEMCVQCVSPCYYGARMLQLLKKEGQDLGEIKIGKTSRNRELALDRPISESIRRSLKLAIRKPFDL